MPFLTSENPTYGRDLMIALLEALSARPAAALLTVPTVHLCVNTPSIYPGMQVADFTEATFVGYAAAAVTLAATEINLPLNGVGAHGEVNFVGGAVVAPGESITGYYVTDDGLTEVYMAELFLNPVPIAFPGDFVSLDVIFGQAAVVTTA